MFNVIHRSNVVSQIILKAIKLFKRKTFCLDLSVLKRMELFCSSLKSNHGFATNKKPQNMAAIVKACMVIRNESMAMLVKQFYTNGIQYAKKK